MAAATRFRHHRSGGLDRRRAESSGQAIGMIAAGVLTGPLGSRSRSISRGALYLAAAGLAVALLAAPPRRLPPRLTKTSA
ncbi:MAG: hypothetical protein M3022_17780 [Actinomycetota bacterium]|nr:hypothetical protein [Actinomycetota bacterium]